ncbi:DUF1127 domain-containing protein [Amphritea balenae]|nr:DUF1127 domain-containing protein [Amphritea balenae]
MSNATICNEVSARNINSKSGFSVAIGSLMNAVTAVRKVLHRWRRNSTSRRQLAGMSSHMLKDIGISRSDVVNEVTKPFWKD